MTTLAEDLHTWIERGRQRIGALPMAPQLERVGRVLQIGDGVASVSGLPDTRLDELLLFEGGVHGLAVDLGEERVVLAEADVETRPEASPALPHEDRTAGHDVAVEPLDAETLRLRVAPVARRALTLFVCHDDHLASGDFVIW